MKSVRVIITIFVLAMAWPGIPSLCGESAAPANPITPRRNEGRTMTVHTIPDPSTYSEDSVSAKVAKQIKSIAESLAAARFEDACTNLSRLEEKYPEETLNFILSLKVHDKPKPTRIGMARVLSRSVGEKDDVFASRVLLANIYSGLGMNDEAIAVMRDILHRSKSARPLYQLINICAGNESIRAVLQLTICKQIIELQPDQPMGYNLLANAYTETGDSDQALAVTRTAVKRWPDDYEVMWDAAYVFRHLGQWDEALSTYKRMTELKPESIQWLRQEIAYSTEARGDLNTAAAVYEEALSTAKEDSHKSAAAENLVRLYAHAGDLDRVIGVLGKLDQTSADPSTIGLAVRILDYIPQERRADLQTRLEPALADKPESILYRLTLVRLYRDIGRIQDATAAANGIVERASGNAEALVALYYLCRWNEGLRPLSIQLLDRLISLKPEKSEYVQWLIDYHLDVNEKDKALLLLGELERKWPNEPHALMASARAYQRMQRYDEALGFYVKATDYGPEFEFSCKYEMAHLHELLGGYETALSLFQDLVSRSPYPGFKTSSMHGLMRNYARTGDAVNAARCLIESEHLDAQQLLYAVQNASEWIPAGSRDKFAAETRKALESEPELLVSRILLVRLYREQNDARQAAAVVHALLPRIKKNTEYLQELVNACWALPVCTEVCRALVGQAPEQSWQFVRLGDAYVQAGMVKEALQAYRMAVDSSGNDETFINGLSQIAQLYARQRDIEQLMDLIESAQRELPRAAYRIMQTARNHIPRASRPDLITALEAARKHRKSSDYALVMLAELYVDARRYTDAAQITADLLHRASDNPDVMRSLAEMGMRNHSLNCVSVEAYRHLVRMEPTEWSHVNGLASAYAGLDDRTNALLQAHVLLRKWPTDPQAVTSAARVLSRFGLWRRAVDAYKQAIRTSPSGYGHLEANIADLLYDKGKFREALGYYESLLSKTPGDWQKREYTKRLIPCYADEGRYDEAAEKALDFEKNADSSVNSLFSDISSHLPAEKQDAFTDALFRKLSDYPDAFYCPAYVARRYAQSQKHDIVKTLMARLLPQALENRQKLESLRITFRHGEGLSEFEVAAYESMSRLAPRDPGIASDLAQTYAKAGMKDKAIEQAERILDTWPQASHDMFEVFRRVGELQKAEAALLRAIASDPRNAEQYQRELENLRERM